MADPQPSSAQPLASTEPVVFSFQRARTVQVQVRFYTDAAGTLEIPSGSGSRDMVITGLDRVRYSELDLDTSIESWIPLGSRTVTGGEWELFGLGAGGSSIKVVASGGVDPGGAASYRVLVQS